MTERGSLSYDASASNTSSGYPRTAIVTGASQGIGAGLVTRFLEKGYNVVGNSRAISASTNLTPSPRLALVGGDIGDCALAIEYAGQGIRINTVALGAIRTPMHKIEAHGFLKSLQPNGRMGEIDEVVDAVMYLNDRKQPS
jgi:NAD(P)-dependent dehydrogenase (short-subunit alcohol dehydrogenase family)